MSLSHAFEPSRAPGSRCPWRLIVSALAALALALPAQSFAEPQYSIGQALKETDNPINDQGSNFNYRSDITSVSPAQPGLGLEVLEFADRLLLTNHTGKIVTVYGYQGEPYARVLPDGTVEVNTSSPAYYLNQNFYGDVTVPASATPTATPHWAVVDKTGQLEWHDHRIHWMSPTTPPEVKDKSKRTKVFPWTVPLSVGSQRVAVHGELLWVPEEGTKTPLAAIIALVAIVIAGGALVYVRRRRTGPPAAAGGAGEAW